MLKRPAQAQEDAHASRSKRPRLQATDDLLSILDLFLPDVLARLTREYMGLTGQIIQELNLGVIVEKNRWPGLWVCETLLLVDSYRECLLWDLFSPWNPRLMNTFSSKDGHVAAFRPGEIFTVNGSDVIVYDTSGHHLREYNQPHGNKVLAITLHKDRILLTMRLGTVRVLDTQDGKLIQTWTLPKWDDNLVSVQGHLYSSHAEHAVIHEISDQDGSCLRTIEMELDCIGSGFEQARVVGALYHELYVWVNDNDKEGFEDSRVHVYHRDTGEYLRTMMEDVLSVSLLPNGYALALMPKGVFLMD